MSKNPFHSLFNRQPSKATIQPTFTPNDSSKQAHHSLTSGTEALHLQLTSFTARDIEILKAMKTVIEPHLPTIIAHFYHELAQIPPLTHIVQQHSTVARLEQTLQTYMLDMFSGEINQQYIAKRKRIGRVHNNIQLSPEWYVAAYTLVQTKVLQLLHEHAPELAETYMSAFMKLCSFDIQIVLTSYIESYTSSMMKLSEIAILQDQLNDSASMLAASAEETTSSINDKERYVDDMSVRIDAVRSSAQQMTTAITEGRHEVEQSSDQLNSISATISDTKHVTEQLLLNASNIADVITTIRAISNRTNILSLNAAIEAARAGEHGKGFAIVAQEVRALAFQTEEALNQIQQQVTEMNASFYSFETSFQHIVHQTAQFSTTNENISTILHDSMAFVAENDEELRLFRNQLDQFQQTFQEISGASLQIANMAEQLSHLNMEISAKFK